MTDWTGFAIASCLLTTVLLVATRRSDRQLERVSVVRDRSAAASTDGPALTTRLLYANVLAAHGLFTLLTVGLLWWFEVPVAEIGVEWPPRVASDVLRTGLIVGIAIGALNEVASVAADRLGVQGPERLRAALAPSGPVDWVLLFGLVLPTIAVFEELLFRGVLVGAFAAGFGIDPWVLVVGSAVAFGLGHGAQGRAGIAVTSVLGAALAAVFVLTESLLVVILAHYVINGVEFLRHEGPTRGSRTERRY